VLSGQPAAAWGGTVGSWGAMDGAAVLWQGTCKHTLLLLLLLRLSWPWGEATARVAGGGGEQGGRGCSCWPGLTRHDLLPAAAHTQPVAPSCCMCVPAGMWLLGHVLCPGSCRDT
jgi:hypothetical protein